MNMFKNAITILKFCLLFTILNCRGEQSDPKDNPVTIEGITLEWKADSIYLNVTLGAQTTGWIALGLDPGFAMKDANLIIGYVKDDSVYIRDDYGNTPTSHRSDVSAGGEDNVINKSGTEENGITTISFSIPLNSGDSRDRPLQIGNNYKILLAHGPDGADDFTTHHEKKTSLKIKL
jgi:hypothetical protein